ncbi:hypothetical protein Cgig2_010576 [Carnegiea gigantea]|uniref:Two-component response regulator n=1 Tax=Carnegiea gigantea TaxID=171969 RepID=A0A9Q1KTM5_9CARY|nr:hypothetical protein Cgig2_010576 [Carnegiea gigantea]
MYGKHTSSVAAMVDDGIRIRILVVDDDSTCLVVIAAMLKSFNYQVATTNNPLEALSTLRLNPEYFDLVLTDVHMPYMSGLELHKIVDQEFHIPVILMSADERRSLVLEGLSNGAAFFIVKPPTQSDLKNLWQYVVSRKKGKNMVSLERTTGMLSSSSTRVDHLHSTTSSLNEERLFLNYPKRNLLEDHQDGEDKNEDRNFLMNRKKPKLIWTTALHNKFLEAIRIIGPNRAVPKKILEYMNIPGLTRENIASHLQKYRIYLRRMCESGGSMQNGMPHNWNETPFRATFSWSQFPTLATNNFLLNYSNNTRPNNTTVSLVNPPFGGCDQGQGFMNTPNNNFAQQQQQQVMMNANTSIGPNSLYGSTNFMAGEINILESSMLMAHNHANANNIGYNGQAGQLGNQGDLGNAAMQFLPPYRPGIPNHMHIHQEQSNMAQMGVGGGDGSDQAMTNNGALETNFNGGTQQEAAQQGTLPAAVGQNEPQPQQEMPNFDVSTVGSPFHLQDWASKNLDEFSLDGIDDLAAFLSSYDANNGSNN